MATASQRRRKMRQRQHYAKAHRFQNVSKPKQLPLTTDGVYQADNFDSCTAAQLQELAKERNVRGRSRMTKPQLIEALRGAG